MARLVDVIEQMIKAMIDENDGQAVISRSQLAEQANCVPSQITYVLSTRFSSGNGYIVESRRGGGGQITITRVSHAGPEHYLQAILDAVGKDAAYQCGVRRGDNPERGNGHYGSGFRQGPFKS